MAKYYYNGVLLPEIPADVLGEYPMCLVYLRSDGQNFRLLAGTKTWFVKDNIRIESSTYVVYGATAESESWTYETQYTDDGNFGIGNGIKWSNHDIPNGSETATTIYFYSTYPIPEADECYYNGVLLPEIPADVLAEYPYAWIRKNTTSGHYDLILSKKVCYQNDGITGGGSDLDLWYRTPISSNDAWVHQIHSYTAWGLDTARTVLWSNRDIRNGSATSTTIYFYGNSPVAAEPETPSGRTRGYLIRSGSALYTITDGALSALTETEVTASLFQTYGVDDLPDGDLLVGLIDPEVLYWQDSTDELPTLSLTVKGAPPLPQVITSGSIDLTHASITGIDHADVDASEDVRFAISFDNGAGWKAFDGSAWFTVSDTAPGMLPSTMNAITAQQWAELATLTSCLVRAWVPAVTSYVGSVVLHYINP